MLSTAVWINLIAYGVSIAFIYGKLSARLNELENKMDKHNHTIERIALLELNVDTTWKRIDELREMIREMKEE